MTINNYNKNINKKNKISNTYRNNIKNIDIVGIKNLRNTMNNKNI